MCVVNDYAGEIVHALLGGLDVNVVALLVCLSNGRGVSNVRGSTMRDSIVLHYLVERFRQLGTTKYGNGVF